MSAGAWALVFAGCGEALPPPEYVGEPLISLPNFVMTLDVDESENGRFMYGVFFQIVDESGVPILVQLPGSGLPVRSALTTFNLFTAPTPEMLLHATPSGARWGLAYIATWQDANGNRTWEEDEFLSSSASMGLLYTSGFVDNDENPYGQAWAPGYHLVAQPPPCLPSQLGMDECGVELGIVCQGNDECGGGARCQTTPPFDRAGYCVLPAEQEDMCAPDEGALIAIPEIYEDRVSRFWARACTQDADCSSATPQYCDALFGVCLPAQGIQLDLHTFYDTNTLCDRVNDAGWIRSDGTIVLDINEDPEDADGEESEQNMCEDQTRDREACEDFDAEICECGD